LATRVLTEPVSGPAGRQDSAWLRRIVFESYDAVPYVRVDGSVSLMKTKEGSTLSADWMRPSRCVQDSSVSRVDASAPALQSHERSGELLYSVAVTSSRGHAFRSNSAA
jgi:hypothetical protein